MKQDRIEKLNSVLFLYYLFVVKSDYMDPSVIFPKNYNFLEKYIWICYTTVIEKTEEYDET